MSYQQTIYNRLRQHGITQAGALGVLGNFDCESNCEPFRLQGDFSPYRTNSHIYVQNVTNGSISREQFSKDAKGFGIYQLTYWSRKQGYYDFWKASGKALDDAELQVDYAVKEMKSDYPNLFTFLCATTDVFTAVSRVCREFERPAVNNIDARYAAAKRIQYEIDLDGGGDEPEPQPAPEPAVDHSLKLRTIDWHCESWDEYDLLVAILRLRGFSVDDWDDEVWDCLGQFQSEQGLTPDKIAGPKTWQKLLEVAT
jgi:hypothetical protein